MTRAIRRLVLVTTELSQTAQRKWGTAELHGKYDCAMLVEAVLEKTSFTATDLNLPDARPARLRWQGGTREWLAAVEHRDLPPPALRSLPTFASAPRLEQLRPSQADQTYSGPWQPPTTTSTGREFGTRVHELLQNLEWDCTAFLDQLKAPADHTPADADRADVIATIQHCLTQPAVATLLRRPASDAELWREQPAVVLHEGKMISAMFDRVQIIPGHKAVIIDYKTNQGAPEELRAHYSEQMRLYRTSVAKLCRLPERDVRCVLIHVRTGTLVEV
jgi:ATP-dependent exoDNAse (exonuclease V) beta subunit